MTSMEAEVRRAIADPPTAGNATTAATTAVTVSPP